MLKYIQIKRERKQLIHLREGFSEPTFAVGCLFLGLLLCTIHCVVCGSRLLPSQLILQVCYSYCQQHHTVSNNKTVLSLTASYRQQQQCTEHITSSTTSRWQQQYCM